MVSPNRAAGHIHFLLHAKPGSKLTFELKNMDNVWNSTRGSVARELKTMCLSENGRDWKVIPTESLPDNRIRFSVEMPGPRLNKIVYLVERCRRTSEFPARLLEDVRDRLSRP